MSLDSTLKLEGEYSRHHNLHQFELIMFWAQYSESLSLFYFAGCFASFCCYSAYIRWPLHYFDSLHLWVGTWL
jgi:hypothetical protein